MINVVCGTRSADSTWALLRFAYFCENHEIFKNGYVTCALAKQRIDSSSWVLSNPKFCMMQWVTSVYYFAA
jgi:hypothetical protein